MSEKRRDHRNCILRDGESQHKDARYAFKYTDSW
ncbi:MAG: integrase DNA-binding domain-containing protein [Clostridiales bacterium]|nr:integrase DNA-binding domain-containing protein [Clostridiales bacterium]